MNTAPATIDDEKAPNRENSLLFAEAIANHPHRLSRAVLTEAHKTDLIDDPGAFLSLLRSITCVDSD